VLQEEELLSPWLATIRSPQASWLLAVSNKNDLEFLCLVAFYMNFYAEA
jgi:hypothetical protein